MACTTVTKVTSVESHSGLPTPPNSTPATDVLGSAVTEQPPPMDFTAVAKILGPITDTLNESAGEPPSPPINSPNVGSPTPSMFCRRPLRDRALSLVRDRLAQLKMDERKNYCYRTPSSNLCSDPEDCGDCECEMVSISEVMSDDCKDKSCQRNACMSMPPPLTPNIGQDLVPIALGSPTVNPRIEEYLSFTSKDLPNQAPAPSYGTTLAEHALSTSATVIGGNSLRSHVSGVTEKSNWAEEVEENMDHACLRLEQLAADEHVQNPTISKEEYYVRRIQRLLGSNKRQVPVIVSGVSRGM